MTNPTPPGQVPDALRFTKRPVTIEAIQWTGKNLREVTTFTDGPPDTQPTQAQAGAVPLNHKNIEPVRRFLADRGIYLSDETTKALITVAHGIKGGQHGESV